MYKSINVMIEAVKVREAKERGSGSSSPRTPLSLEATHYKYTPGSIYFSANVFFWVGGGGGGKPFVSPLSPHGTTTVV